jgi:hypothetical protein
MKCAVDASEAKSLPPSVVFRRLTRLTIEGRPTSTPPTPHALSTEAPLPGEVDPFGVAVDVVAAVTNKPGNRHAEAFGCVYGQA